MWSSVGFKQRVLATPSLALEDVNPDDDLSIVAALRQALGKEVPREEEPKLDTFSSLKWGVALLGLAAVAKKLSDLDVMSFLPSLKDWKVTLGLAPPAEATVDQTQVVKPSFATPPQPVTPDLGNVQLTEPTEQIKDVISNAAKVVGIDLSLLLAIVHQESRFKAGAKAATSSAQGLFQITAQTWRHLVSRYGKAYGITIKDIRDPVKHAIMGAQYVKDLVVSVTRTLSRAPSATDVYVAFVLGPSGAKVLLDAVRDTPKAIAADLLPRAAKSNRSIFYTKEGKPKTVLEVYATFYGKVGLQYLKFSESQGQKPQMSAVNPDVTLPPVVSQPEVIASTTLSVPASPATTSSYTATPVEFDIPPKLTKDKAAPTVLAAAEQNPTVAPVMRAPDKRPTDYLRVSRGSVLAMRG